MNIQNLEHFKTLSANEKKEVLKSLKRMENMQEDNSFMTEFSEELLPNHSNAKQNSNVNMENKKMEKAKDIKNEVAIKDILLEYNPEFNAEFSSFDNDQTLDMRDDFTDLGNIEAYKNLENIVYDDFMT